MNKNKLIVDRNLVVSIEGFYQFPTYVGLIEGLPHDRLNQMIIEQAKRRAEHIFQQKALHLITPTQTPIEYKGEYGFGVPMSLPSACCISNLTHFGSGGLKNKNNEEDWFISTLIVIWFQDDFAFPIASDILTQIKDIPFRKLCVETEF